MTTQEQSVAHQYRYGSITRREGPRGVSWHARLRNPGSVKPTWLTATRHSYAEICKVLEGWNQERERMFLEGRSHRSP